VKFIDEKRNRSFKTILRFFEDSDFRYQTKKSQRTRYHDYFERFYLNYCYLRDHDLIDIKIGEGHDKVVFKLSNSPHKALKLYKDTIAFDQERTNYEILLEHGLENIVPKMEFHNQYSVSDLARSVSETDIPEALKNILFDRTLANFGVSEGKIIVLDLDEVDSTYVEENLRVLEKINRF